MTETRAEKAQRLVDEGRVAIVHSTFHSTQAVVRGKDEAYTTILYADGHFFCTCDWGVTHSHTDELCAHALAVKLAVSK